jgi:hypothetical protein
LERPESYLLKAVEINSGRESGESTRPGLRTQFSPSKNVNKPLSPFQVELFGGEGDGENPNSDLGRKSFPVSVNTSEAWFGGSEDEVKPMAGALRKRQKESSHKSVTEFLNVALLGTGSSLVVFILLPLGIFIFLRRREMRRSSRHPWLLDYLEDVEPAETVSGHGDKPNKITTTIHRGNNTSKISPYGSLQFPRISEVYVFPFSKILLGPLNIFSRKF